MKGLIYVSMLTYFLSKQTVGDIGYLNSLATMLVPLLMLNMPDSSNRILLKRTDNLENLHPVYETIRWVSVIGMACLLLITYLTILIFPNAWDHALYACLMCVARVIYKLHVYEKEIFQKSRQMVVINVAFEYIPLLPIILYIAHWYQGYLFPLAITSLLVISFIARAEWNAIINLRRNQIDKTILKSILSISMFLMPALYGQLFMQTSDLIIVKWLLGSESVSDYVVSNSLASLMLAVSAGVSYFWYSSVNYISTKALRRLLIIIFLAAPLLALATYWCIYNLVALIQLRYWQHYEMSHIAPLIGIFYILLAIVQILSGMMYSKAKDREILMGSILSILSNVGFGYILISNIGLAGAAYSSLISASLLIFYFSYVVLKEVSKQEV